MLNIRGFHHSALRWCSMHTVNLGLCHWVAGSVMIMLLQMEDSWGFICVVLSLNACKISSCRIFGRHPPARLQRTKRMSVCPLHTLSSWNGLGRTRSSITLRNYVCAGHVMIARLHVRNKIKIAPGTLSPNFTHETFGIQYRAMQR